MFAMNITGIGALLLGLCAISEGMFFKDRKVKTKCATGVWSEWTCVGSRCGRTRQIYRPASNGGTACGPLREEKNSTAKADPWNQEIKTVTRRVQSKVVAGTKRTITLAGEVRKSSPEEIVEHTEVILPRDVLFLLDMSGSISRKDFALTKSRLAELIGQLCGSVGPGKQHNRISVVSFSSNVKINFDFKKFSNLGQVKSAILAIQQERGLTCTGKAFQFAHDVMFDPSKGVRSATESVKEVNVLTDGKSNCNRTQLVENIQKLQVKAFVFAMAIGTFDTKSQEEIASYVSRPLIDHLFSLSNFQSFADMVDAIKKCQCPCVPLELS